jgi:hypothetical protein
MTLGRWIASFDTVVKEIAVALLFHLIGSPKLDGMVLIW